MKPQPVLFFGARKWENMRIPAGHEPGRPVDELIAVQDGGYAFATPISATSRALRSAM
ncbi:hypothetical protein [Sphingobium sp. S6]|uniref:hypothetical protein n=1 Tax=Sphingobium sp. S6 TaxID=2758386 RepID=UPI001A13E4FE|nr:hypothetical protein [Sphingobium sp. S6]CAD7338243.1 hypothetical protein SPHS6_01915 [Sphingobium sp. S6]CAD7338726.1 hypothetical protein SPHS8_02197 [Sphingobium sp. S8]